MTSLERGAVRAGVGGHLETIDAELRGAWLATLNGCSPSIVHIERAARGNGNI
jgi:hypothetical protein